MSTILNRYRQLSDELTQVNSQIRIVQTMFSLKMQPIGYTYQTMRQDLNWLYDRKASIIYRLNRFTDNLFPIHQLLYQG